jgi:hypothetical protein
MLERFKGMPADEQKQFIARSKARGGDVGEYEKLAGASAKAAPAASPLVKSKYGAPQSAQTIDALFAPLQSIETQGRAWLYMDKQLKPVRLRLGITDGTNTELLSSELQPAMELVTGVVMSGPRTTTGGAGAGNPLMGPQRGGPGGPGGPGRGR